jgi:hypothetical protein
MTNPKPKTDPTDINEYEEAEWAEVRQAKAQAKVQSESVPPEPPRSKLYETLKEMNTRHAIIDNFAGKTVIATLDETSLLDPSKKTVVYQHKSDFVLRYSNRHMTIEIPDGKGGRKNISQQLGQWWLAHRDRRQHRGVTFEPKGEETIDGCLNLWKGWGVVEPEAQGDWGLIRQHIVEVIAGGNPVFAEYVIRWIGWAIQNPNKQAEVALVLIGEKGVGKGTLGRCLQRIFGAHAFQVTTPDEVVGRFNAHLQDCVLLIADEAYWVGGERQKACVGRLQAMITEPLLSIEPKGIGIFQVRNLLHIIMLAEPGWVIPAGRHERRYAALEVSDKRLGDREYFKALHQQINKDGAEAMFYDLKRMKLGDWHPREIPESLLHSAALRKQQGYSMSPVEQWYLGLLQDGRLPEAKAKRPNRASSENLRKHAGNRFPRLRFDLTDNALANFLDETAGKGVGNVCTKHRTSEDNGWSFPLLADARAVFEKFYGSQNWDPTRPEWGEMVDLLDEVIDTAVTLTPTVMPDPIPIPTMPPTRR